MVKRNLNFSKDYLFKQLKPPKFVCFIQYIQCLIFVNDFMIYIEIICKLLEILIDINKHWS